MKHYAYHTEQAYIDWKKRFIFFHKEHYLNHQIFDIDDFDENDRATVLSDKAFIMK